MQFGAECQKDWFKLGGEVLFNLLHWGLHGCIDGCNIGTELFHFFLGLNETIFQGVEASFQVLAMIMAMRMGELKRGGWGKKNCWKNDLDECDKGEEMNPME